MYLMFKVFVFYNFFWWQQLQGISQFHDLDRIASSGRKVKWISILQNVDCFVFEWISLYTILDINDIIILSTSHKIILISFPQLFINYINLSYVAISNFYFFVNKSVLSIRTLLQGPILLPNKFFSNKH